MDDGPGQWVGNNACPDCGHLLTGATSIRYDQGNNPIDLDGTVKPKTGDFTICINCASLLIFHTPLFLRKPNIMDLFVLQSEPGLWQSVVNSIAKVQEVIDSRGQT